MNRKLSNLFKKFRYVRKNREDEQQKAVSENDQNIRDQVQTSPVDVFNHRSRVRNPSSEDVNPKDMNEEELEVYCNEREHRILYQLMDQLDEGSRPKKNRKEVLFRGDCVPEEYAVVVQVISRVHLDFSFSNETLFYTIDLARRYLSIVGKAVTASDFVVVLFTALFISSKFEEVDHLFIDELLQLAKKYRYFAEVFKNQTVREIRRKFRYANLQDLEVKMITKLRFKPVNRAISNWFAREYYHTKNRLDSFECNLSQFILECTLFNFSTCLKFSNKEIAAAAVNLVSRMNMSEKGGPGGNGEEEGTGPTKHHTCSDDDIQSIKAVPNTSNRSRIEECEKMLYRTLKEVIENEYNRHRNRKIFPKEREFIVKNFKKLEVIEKLYSTTTTNSKPSEQTTSQSQKKDKSEDEESEGEDESGKSSKKKTKTKSSSKRKTENASNDLVIQDFDLDSTSSVPQKSKRSMSSKDLMKNRRKHNGGENKNKKEPKDKEEKIHVKNISSNVPLRKSYSSSNISKQKKKLSKKSKKGNGKKKKIGKKKSSRK